MNLRVSSYPEGVIPFFVPEGPGVRKIGFTERRFVRLFNYHLWIRVISFLDLSTFTCLHVHFVMGIPFRLTESGKDQNNTINRCKRFIWENIERSNVSRKGRRRF